MVLRDSDLQIRKTSHTVNGISSLGGSITSTVVTDALHSLWDEAKSNELSSSVVGEYEVRCVGIYNNSANNETFVDLQVYVDQQTAAPFTDIDIAWGAATTAGDEEQTVANEDTMPLHVFFTFARGEQNALFGGDIAKGEWRPLWIRRHAGPARADSSYPGDNYVLGFKVRASSETPEPPPTDPPPGGGGGGPSVNDPFGVRKVYPDAPAGPNVTTPVYMDRPNPNTDHCRIKFNDTVVRNADGSFRMSSANRSRTQIYIRSSECAKDFFTAKRINAWDFDHSEWASRGYIYSPIDWKNIELTCYFKIVSNPQTSDAGFSLYSRGVRHNETVADGCGGSAYKADLDINGKWQVTKEIFHNPEEDCGYLTQKPKPRPDSGIGSLKNKWFGYKTALWNYKRQSDNKTCVHMELWVDKDANNTWQKIGEINDTGGWYPGAPSTSCPGGENCGAARDEIMTWGSPISDMRWDDMQEVHFKWLSCREITPPSGEPNSAV